MRTANIWMKISPSQKLGMLAASMASALTI